MADYRDQLYERYFQNQAGRRLGGNMQDMMREHWTHLEREILSLLPNRKDIKILDLGCGFGELLMLLREKGWQNCEGIDISREQVEKARELGVPGVQQADAMQFFADKQAVYDVILGIDIIEHFGKDELLQLLGAIKGALKPEGFALFRTPNMDAPYTSTYAFGDFTHLTFLNHSSAQQLFFSAGFNNTQVLPSAIKVEGALKEGLRKMVWSFVKLQARLALFASGKSTKGVYFTPNLIIKAQV